MACECEQVSVQSPASISSSPPVFSPPVPSPLSSLHVRSSSPSVPPVPVPVPVSKASIPFSVANLPVSSEVKKLSRFHFAEARSHSVYHAADTREGDYYTLDLDVEINYKDP